MPNLSTVVLNEGQSNEESALQFSYIPTTYGEYKVTLNTKNNFIDKNIIVDVDVAQASAPALTLTDLNSNLSMGSASEGYYTPAVSISGNATIASAGWIASGSYAVSDSSVFIGKIIQSVLKNGTTDINSGAEIIAGSSDQTINITEGYNSSRTIVVKANTPASFANAATSGVTYTDISTSAPVLITNDYLYVNAGSVDNVKISLAQLVPDDATISASTGAGYILSGETAYDSDGQLIVGNIPTYTGSYTVES